MGLDITAYGQLERAPEFDTTMDEYLPEKIIKFWVNKDFPGREEPIEHLKAYKYKVSTSFCAGSYGGYNVFRKMLALAACYLPEAAWNGVVTEGRFYELVNFADNEGTIGPKVAAKLAKDFIEMREKVQKLYDPYFLEKYDEWMEAFTLAADNGAISFH